MKTVISYFCIFVVLGCYALPPPMWRAGETKDPDASFTASVQSHLPSLTSGLSKLPLKFPSQMPTIPVHPSAVEGIPSPIAIFAVDPSKMVPGIKGPLPFNPVAIGTSFVKPIANFPFVVADQAYEIPLQAWDSVKNIVDTAVHLPKDEISAGQKAVDGFFSAFSG